MEIHMLLYQLEIEQEMTDVKSWFASLNIGMNETKVNRSLQIIGGSVLKGNKSSSTSGSFTSSILWPC